jgi:hypothetical protein
VAVPSSGALSLFGIANEIDDNDYTATSFQGQVSLQHFGSGGEATINTNSASYPNTAAPHTMGEWYSYDHDAAAAWNNNTDWYSAAVNSWWNTYEKFRVDFGYSSSYSGSGTNVNDVEGWGSDCDIISSAVHTASTSTTTPGYITGDGSADCVHSWDEGALQSPMDLAGGGGTTIMIWFRKHTAHNGTLFSISDNTNSNKLLEINSLSGGAFQIRAKDTSGNWHTRTTSTTAFPTNVWRCLVANFDSYQGNKGATYRIKGYCNAYNGGGGRWEAVDDGSSSDTLSTVAWDTETVPYGIGCIPSSGVAGTNVFDGDIALVSIMKGVGGNYGSATDSKLDGWIDSTHEKMGL